MWAPCITPLPRKRTAGLSEAPNHVALLTVPCCAEPRRALTLAARGPQEPQKTPQDASKRPPKRLDHAFQEAQLHPSIRGAGGRGVAFIYIYIYMGLLIQSGAGGGSAGRRLDGEVSQAFSVGDFLALPPHAPGKFLVAFVGQGAEKHAEPHLGEFGVFGAIRLIVSSFLPKATASRLIVVSVSLLTLVQCNVCTLYRAHFMRDFMP